MQMSAMDSQVERSLWKWWHLEVNVAIPSIQQGIEVWNFAAAAIGPKTVRLLG